jgi:uncharacterized protein YodC (DUF2158 family)
VPASGAQGNGRRQHGCLRCRWYTGGGAGGSGQEVIAPGTGAEKVKGFMDAIQPHARQGTADDLEAKQGAFSGSSRTLNGAHVSQQVFHSTQSGTLSC